MNSVEMWNVQSPGLKPFPTAPRTTNVGMFRPNQWSLYDMHGNVSEWCSDHPIDSYGSFFKKSPIDETPRVTNDMNYPRAIRGGHFGAMGGHCRSASRSFKLLDIHLRP